MSFRNDYLDHAALSAQLHAWADAHPAFVRLRTIGTTAEGRAIELLVIGPEPDRPRPAIWIDGNMHASELCGSSVALAIAEDAISLHTSPARGLHGMPRHLIDALREVHFYVLPRMSPDGAEAVLKTGRYVRSVPRDLRKNKQHARWTTHDVDGDGLALAMRQEDPTGEFVSVDGMLVPRGVEDAGPFYKLYPEGSVEGFDGFTVPSPAMLQDNDPDLNRNFPYSWAPEPDQLGAGAYPGSEAESRAVIELANATPTLFAWINLHTFGGVFIRPLGDKADAKMDQGDLAIFRQAAAWGDELVGYPTVSGFEEFLYEPERPLRGDLTDFAYHQRGCYAVAIELWDLFRQAELPQKKRFVDHYTHLDREDFARIARWDREKNASRVLVPWRKLTHPQLGAVEVGGLDPRFGFWNPPRSELAEVCRKLSAWVMKVAALAPRVCISKTSVTRLADGLSRVDAVIENLGYLASCGLPSARRLPWNEPLSLMTRTSGGLELVTASEARQELGHLDGWGRGLYDGTSALYATSSRGSTSKRRASVLVRGKGSCVLRVGSCRVGHVEAVVEVG